MKNNINIKKLMKDCADLNTNERGEYLTLLFLQSNVGHFSENHLVNKNYKVREKFSKDGNNLYFSKLLESKSINVKVEKYGYGDYSNVMLSDKEYLEAMNKYGDKLPKMIAKLDTYIQTSGTRYKDFMAVFSKWVEKAVDADQKKSISKKTESVLWS